MEEIIKDVENKSRILLDSLKQDFAGIRTNRPNPQLVENIQVEYMDQVLTVKQLGSISISPPRDIVISLWDKSAANTVAKAIESSPMRFSPSVDGNLIRVKLPALTEERRAELNKVAKSSAEEVRIKIRNIRDENNKKVEAAFKAKTLSEDQKFKAKDRIQKAVDRVNVEVESMLGAKVKEISE